MKLPACTELRLKNRLILNKKKEAIATLNTE